MIDFFHELANMFMRGTVKKTDDTTEIQEIQARVTGDDDVVEVPRYQQYGFTSVPKEGAEAILIQLDAEDSIVIAVDDRTYRLTGLSGGDVALYDSAGSKVVLKPAENKIIIEATTVELGEGAAESVVKGDAFKTLFNAHTHQPGTYANSGGPVAGVSGTPVVTMGAAELSTKVKTG